MYPATASIGAALQKLNRYPSQDKLIIDARNHLKTAQTIMSERWSIHYSIYWNGSNARTKYSICAKLEGTAYDARTALINAGTLLNLYVDHNYIPTESLNNWQEIIRCLINADRWFTRDYIDSNAKQLKILGLE